MELYIQLGHGMQGLCKDLVSQYNGNISLILSPVNQTPTQILKFSKDIKKLNARVLLDPQLYYPRKYHKNLPQHAYWPQNDITLLEDGQCKELISSLAELNRNVQSDFFILPSSIEKQPDRRWDAVQKQKINVAREVAPDMKLLHTIALTGDVLLDDTRTETIIQYVENWDVEGVYIVSEHPDRYYLIDKPLWLTNLLGLVAGIKRSNKKVIVGYANHQMLCLALSKCDAIASGNFLNVRWFQPERFETIDSDAVSRRSTWYYCPQTFTEYKIPFLDIAYRMNVLPALAPPQKMMNNYSNMLFQDGLPSSTNYSESDAHRHYLHCLSIQCADATQKKYTATLDAYLVLLDTADALLSVLRAKGIKGQDRDFGEIIDVNRAAVVAHDMSYGFSLSQEWDSFNHQDDQT